MRIRVLFADDSTVLRKLLKEVLDGHPQMDVVGMAGNGREAVQLFPRVMPDVVLLDVEMPIMDGIESVEAIRKIDPFVPILMFSSLTSKGSEATLDALSCGANDYVAKPSRMGHLDDALAYVRENLIPKIIAWGTRKIDQPAPRPLTATQFVPAPSRAARAIHAELLAIGVSTGGPKALATMLTAFPPDFPIPIVIVQHMPPMFTQLMAGRLDAVCQLRVREAPHGALLQRGDVWVAPGDRHLRVARGGVTTRLELDDSPPHNYCRPSVDVLFRSVARLFRDRCLAVVLTGMGRDGLEGSHEIFKCGGRILVQDEGTSTVWGMPRVVAEAGLADKVVPLHDMASEICRLVYQREALPAERGCT